ncbi:MAG: permease-like cell division protein FtsX [Acidobacteria bacterium]|nr:permease-like cell division protein FtsX [Acidobacteriota bacterium]
MSAALAAGSIALALVLTTASLLIGNQTDRLSDHWTGRADITVYLCARASASPRCGGVTTDEQIAAHEALIAARPEVTSYWFENQADAWKAFTERFSGSSIVENLDASALPESYRIKLVDGTDREAFVDDLEEQLGTVGGFEIVQDQRNALAGFFSVANRLRTGALALAALQAGISLALLTHLLRSSVTRRNKDIRVMSLVGTSHRQIRAPFMFEALVVYTAGVALAAGAVLGGLNVARNMLERAGGTDALLVADAAALRHVAALYLAGLAVGWLTVRLTLRTRLRETN